jgi:hypothetical protein
LQYSEGPNGTGVMRYQKAAAGGRADDANPPDLRAVAQARRRFEASEAPWFPHFRSPGIGDFISFTPWLCPSGGGTVNFDTDEVLINNPAPGDADVRRVRTVAARRSARVRPVPEVSETDAGRRRRRLATCDWPRWRPK